MKQGAGLQKVSATGGTLEAATVLTGEDRMHAAPSFLPDGVHFLYLAGTDSAQQPELRVGSLESKEMVESLGPIRIERRCTLADISSLSAADTSAAAASRFRRSTPIDAG